MAKKKIRKKPISQDSIWDSILSILLWATTLYIVFLSWQTYTSNQNSFITELTKPSTIVLEGLKELKKPAEVLKPLPDAKSILKAISGLPGGVSVFTESGYRVMSYNAQKPFEPASNVKAGTTLAILLNNGPEVIKQNLPAIYDMMAHSDNYASVVLGQKLVGSPKEIQDKVNKELGTNVKFSSRSGYNAGIEYSGGPKTGFGETSYASADDMVQIIMALARVGKQKGIDIGQILGNTRGPGTLHIHAIKDRDTGETVLIYGKTGTLHNVKAFSGFMVTKKGVKVYFSIIVNAPNGRGYIGDINEFLLALYYS